jgi:hypothetical protein
VVPGVPLAGSCDRGRSRYSESESSFSPSGFVSESGTMETILRCAKRTIETIPTPRLHHEVSDHFSGLPINRQSLPACAKPLRRRRVSATYPPYQDAEWINLLDPEMFRVYSARPGFRAKAVPRYHDKSTDYNQ